MPCTDKACEAALKKTKMCAYFRKGRCSRGTDCTFAHSPAELNNRPNLSKTRFCIPFQHSGTCSMGTACRFAHDERELRPISKQEERENQRRINAARRTAGFPALGDQQAQFHQGLEDYQELEFDHDFSRQTSFEDCKSNFSRQTSVEQTQLRGFQQRPPTYVPTLYTISRHNEVGHRKSHSPSGSSNESLVFYKSEDSEGQRIIRLMEHLIDEGDEQVQNRLTKMDVYHNQAQNGTPNQRRLWDDLMNDNGAHQEEWDSVMKFGNPDGSYSQYVDPKGTHGAQSAYQEGWESKSGYSGAGYSQYCSPKASHGDVFTFGTADLNCNIQNTFLHFTETEDPKPLRRSNSLGALPLRGL